MKTKDRKTVIEALNEYIALTETLVENGEFPDEARTVNRKAVKALKAMDVREESAKS